MASEQPLSLHVDLVIGDLVHHELYGDGKVKGLMRINPWGVYAIVDFSGRTRRIQLGNCRCMGRVPSAAECWTLEWQPNGQSRPPIVAVSGDVND